MSDILIRRMTLRDVDGVFAVEQASFPKPWRREDFVKEMTANTCARYLVAEREERIIGFAGAWIVLDEAHITNIAVLPAYRGQGTGKALTSGLLQYAANLGVVFATLEVRRSNLAAQKLYESEGFVRAGVKRGYYQDSGEDACVYVNQDLPEGNEENDPYLVRE